MTASVNGKDVLAATITEAVTGAWSAELELDSEEKISGRVTIDIDGVAWFGTVTRGELESGRFHAQVVGGNGALGKELPAKHYLRARTLLHLTEVTAAGGEKLSKDTDARVLERATARYTRRRATIGASVAQIARESKANWRFLRDGTLWLGTDSWPASSAKYDELERSHTAMVVSVEEPLITVGTTLSIDGVARKIITVVTRVNSSELTQALTFADDASAVDRMRRTFTGIVESLFGHRMDFGAWYPAQVVAQVDDDTVDLYPDDELMRGTGISRVPLRHGLPGCTVKVKPGSRCILFYEDCDPSKPAAGLWADGSSVLSIAIDADTKLTLKAPTVQIDGDLTVSGTVTASDCIAAPQPDLPVPLPAVSLQTHVHLSTAPGNPTGTPIPQPPP
jgi:hypothetical protein